MEEQQQEKIKQINITFQFQQQKLPEEKRMTKIHTFALASIDAPCARSIFAASLHPFLAAMCNGVSPYYPFNNVSAMQQKIQD